MVNSLTLPDGSRRLHVILHGKLAGHSGFRDAVRVVRQGGHQIQVNVTWEAGDAVIHAGRAVKAGAEVVIAAGGDGTVNGVLQGLVQAGLPARCAMGVVPLGTANDFATGAGLPLSDPLAALRLIAEGQARPIDIGRVNDRWFLNVVSGGPATQFTEGTPEGIKAVFGAAGYLLTGAAMLPKLAPVGVELKGPDWEWSGRLVVFAVGNGKLAGGGIPLCSQASLTDGLLDMLLIPESEENDFIGMVTNLLRLHLPAQGARVIYKQLPWLELKCAATLNLHVDGEPLNGTQFRWEVFPGPLPFLLPRDALGG